MNSGTIYNYNIMLYLPYDTRTIYCASQMSTSHGQSHYTPDGDTKI